MVPGVRADRPLGERSCCNLWRGRAVTWVNDRTHMFRLGAVMSMMAFGAAMMMLGSGRGDPTALMCTKNMAYIHVNSKEMDGIRNTLFHAGSLQVFVGLSCLKLAEGTAMEALRDYVGAAAAAAISVYPARAVSVRVIEWAAIRSLGARVVVSCVVQTGVMGLVAGAAAMVTIPLVKRCAANLFQRSQ